MPNTCAGNPPITSLSASPAWNGWGADSSNARFQTAQAAGISAEQVQRLRLKWAFGFPGATSVYGQPSVVAGRVFMGVAQVCKYISACGSGSSIQGTVRFTLDGYREDSANIYKFNMYCPEQK